MGTKKISTLILFMALMIGVMGCNSNKVKDKQIIGTWENSMGLRYVFKENGKVEVLSTENIRDYEADNGTLKISYGKFGDDYYTYQIGYLTTEQGETTQYLIIDGHIIKGYLIKKKSYS